MKFTLISFSKFAKLIQHYPNLSLSLSSLCETDESAYASWWEWGWSQIRRQQKSLSRFQHIPFMIKYLDRGLPHDWKLVTSSLVFLKKKIIKTVISSYHGKGSKIPNWCAIKQKGSRLMKESWCFFKRVNSAEIFSNRKNDCRQTYKWQNDPNTLDRQL